MRKKIALIIVLQLLLFTCTEEIAGPTEYIFPEKLYPYEDSYAPEEFLERRTQLMDALPADAIVIITTNDTYVRNGSVDYEFRPSSLFFYLTGFDEPSAFAMLKRRSSREIEFTMFVQEISDWEIQWLGDVAGIAGAMEFFHADTAYDVATFWDYVEDSSAITSGVTIYNNFAENESVQDQFETRMGSEIPTMGLKTIVDGLRLIKSDHEIELIQRAVDVTVQSFKEMIKELDVGRYEYEMEAVMNYVAGAHGCPRAAFPPIVACGSNLNTLHYSANDGLMTDGELVMIDFGVEYGYYTSDITRTLPVNGKFSDEQKTVYNVVRNAHEEVIRQAAPGVNYYDLYLLEVRMILDGLIAHSIISGNRDQIIESGQYRQYIVGGLGHCIGLDVHDPFPRTGQYEKLLQENMVLAFEPHVYLYEGDATVDSDYWNVSARIEDDVLITESGCIVLSQDLPYEISELEAMFD